MGGVVLHFTTALRQYGVICVGYADGDLRVKIRDIAQISDAESSQNSEQESMMQSQFNEVDAN